MSAQLPAVYTRVSSLLWRWLQPTDYTNQCHFPLSLTDWAQFVTGLSECPPTYYTNATSSLLHSFSMGQTNKCWGAPQSFFEENSHLLVFIEKFYFLTICTIWDNFWQFDNYDNLTISTIFTFLTILKNLGNLYNFDNLWQFSKIFEKVWQLVNFDNCELSAVSLKV